MKKQILCGILAAVLIACMFPMSALATTDDYHYHLKIQTRNVSGAGTDANVHAGFVFYDYGIYSELMDTYGYDDFEKGDFDDYYLSTDGGDPWMLKEVYLYNDGSGAGSEWAPGKVYVYKPFLIYDGALNLVSVDFSGTLIDRTSATRDCSGQTARKISSWGGFDDWGSTGDLNSDSSVSLVRTWDNLITDQYSTYNPFGFNDAPTLTCKSSNDAVTGYTFTTGSVSSPTSFDLDYQTVYQQMVSAAIDEVTFTFELKFPERTTKMTDGYTNVHTETITVSRSAIAAILANSNIDTSRMVEMTTVSPTTVKSDYAWTIKLNDIVKESSIPDKIYVTNSKGIIQATTCTVTSANGLSQIKVTPDINYTPDDYILWVREIESIGETKIENQVYLRFTVE